MEKHGKNMKKHGKNMVFLQLRILKYFIFLFYMSIHKKYNCESCDFHTNLKGDFSRHLLTKKHMESTKSQHLVNQKSTFSQPKVNLFMEKRVTPFQCHYCLKYFKFKQSMYKHIKYSCKKNKDESMKELARLLNEKEYQLQDKNNQIEKIQVNMQKQIDKLTQKLQIQNIIHGNVTHTRNEQHNNNIYNIHLLNHSDTDYSHLTHRDYVRCIKDCNHCVKTLIEKVHFNETKPENMNIYISNIKGNYAMIYREYKWQIVNKKEQIDDLFDYNEVVLETWYDDYKEQYPEIIQSFKRYLTNRDDSEVINRVKSEILYMLYNNRNMIAEG